MMYLLQKHDFQAWIGICKRLVLMMALISILTGASFCNPIPVDNNNDDIPANQANTVVTIDVYVDTLLEFIDKIEKDFEDTKGFMKKAAARINYREAFFDDTWRAIENIIPEVKEAIKSLADGEKMEISIYEQALEKLHEDRVFDEQDLESISIDDLRIRAAEARKILSSCDWETLHLIIILIKDLMPIYEHLKGSFDDAQRDYRKQLNQMFQVYVNLSEAERLALPPDNQSEWPSQQSPHHGQSSEWSNQQPRDRGTNRGGLFSCCSRPLTDE